MEKHTDIELSPFEYQGNKFRVFLTHDDKFASSVVCVGYFVADSRAELEAGIEEHVRDFLGQFGQSPHVPIMRIDSNATSGFDLSRFQVMLPTRGLYSWHTHQKLSVLETNPLPDTFPTKLAGLPFIDTPVGRAGWVYYAVFKERVWVAFQKLNGTLEGTLARNKNDIISYISSLDAVSLPNDGYYNDLYKKLHKRILSTRGS